MAQIKLPAEFVDREKELGFLRSKLSGLLEGRGGTIFIAGECGVGKTRLMEEFFKEAERSEVQVLRGSCNFGSLTPFLPFIEMLKAIGQEHLILEQKPPKLEGLYAVEKNSGLLVAKYTREDRIDADIFTGMVTAVRSFIMDSIKQMKAEEAVIEDIQRMSHGSFNIVSMPGKLLNLIAIISGREDEFFLNDIKELLQKIEEEFGGIIAEWRGNYEKTQPVEEVLKNFIGTGRYEGIDFAKDEPKIRQSKMFENVLRALQRRAEKKPLIIVFENLQWVDASSVALLHYVSRNLQNQKAMVIATYRPEETVSHEGALHPVAEVELKMVQEGIVEKIELERLKEQDCRQLVQVVMGSECLDRFVKKIFEQTEGNPLFVIETLKTIVEENLVPAAGEEVGLKIPKKVHDLISWRIRKLNREEREIAELASVIGEEFNAEIIQKVSGKPRIELLKVLTELERTHKLLLSTRQKYRFEHSMVREVLYNELPEGIRTAYHEAIAQFLEADYRSQNKIELLPEIFSHYLHTDQKEKIVEFGLLAARNARQRYANEESSRMYMLVLDRMEGDERYAETEPAVLEELADVLALVGKYDEALKFLNQKLERCAGIEAESVRILVKAAEIRVKKADYGGAIADALKALEIVLKNQDLNPHLPSIYSITGLVHERKGDYRKALEYQEKALALGNGDEEAAKILNRIGVVHYYLGEYTDALKFCMRSAEVAEKAGNLIQVASAFNNIGIIHRERNEYGEALEYALKALAVRQKIGDVWGIAMGYNNIAQIHSGQGKYKEALEYYLRSLSILERIGDVWGIAGLCGNIGVIYTYTGEFSNAMEFFKRSLDMREKLGDIPGVALIYNNLGNLYCEMGEPERGYKYFHDSNKIVRETGEKTVYAYNLFGMAEAKLEMGASDEAKILLDEVLELAEKLGLSELKAQGSREYGKLKGSEEHFERSLQIYETSGIRNIEYYKTLYEYGRFRGDAQMLTAALNYFESIGNKVWAERVRREWEKLKGE